MVKRFLTRDGRTRWLRVVVTPIAEAGEVRLLCFEVGRHVQRRSLRDRPPGVGAFQR